MRAEKYIKSNNVTPESEDNKTDNEEKKKTPMVGIFEMVSTKHLYSKVCQHISLFGTFYAKCVMVLYSDSNYLYRI